jgi:hypothetical protein
MASLKTRVGAGLVFGLVCVLAQGQSGGMSSSNAQSAAVQYLYPEQVILAAGKPGNVALHFRIAQGMHINSHVPREDYLIPTTFSIPDGAGVRLKDAAYPPGTDLTLPIDPKTRLSVYTGEFIIQANIVAVPGNHLVEAKLHFQACDNSQCLPPRTIPVAFDVIGK